MLRGMAILGESHRPLFKAVMAEILRLHALQPLNTGSLRQIYQVGLTSVCEELVNNKLG